MLIGFENIRRLLLLSFLVATSIHLGPGLWWGVPFYILMTSAALDTANHLLSTNNPQPLVLKGC